MLDEKILNQANELNKIYYELSSYSSNCVGIRIKDIITQEILLTMDFNSDKTPENFEHLKKLNERMFNLWKELRDNNPPGVLNVYMVISDYLLHEEYIQASQTKKLLEIFNC